MQATTAKSLGVWKCLCKSYRCTESQYRHTLCSSSYNVTFVKFHRFPGGLKLFCNLNRNLWIKLIAWRLCELQKHFICFFRYWKSNYFSGDLCVYLPLPARRRRHLLQPTQTERALSLPWGLPISNARGFSPHGNTPDAASSLGCLRTLVYGNAHIRDLLFSLRKRC